MLTGAAGCLTFRVEYDGGAGGDEGGGNQHGKRDTAKL
jgi:hypothetical protein